MKKTYISPAIQVVKIETASIMAASIRIDRDLEKQIENSKDILSKESIWYNEEEEEQNF